MFVGLCTHPYRTCDFCLKSRWFMANHFKSSFKGYTCGHCGKSFKTISKRNFHVKDCHPTDPEDKKCKQCHKEFSGVSSCKRHQNTCPEHQKYLWQPNNNDIKVDAFKSHINNRHSPFKRRTDRSEALKEMLKSFESWLHADYITVNFVVLAEETKSKFITQFGKILDWLEVSTAYVMCSNDYI